MPNDITQTIREAIIQEKLHRQAAARLDHFDLISCGKRQEAIENLIFFSDPIGFTAACKDLLGKIVACFENSDPSIQAEQLAFLVEMTLALQSILPRWNLAALLSQDQIQAVAEEIRVLLLKLAAPDVEKGLLAAIEADAGARYKAEQAPDPAEAAHSLVGNSIQEYLTNACQEIASSCLRSLAEMRFEGKTNTELSNDYAAFLQHTLYLGASFATTNPPLVNMALGALSGIWDPVVDQIILSNPDANGQDLAKLVTLEVVLEQMRLLRPIFLVTEGRMGCVCFQVDPNQHGDAEAMIEDALFFYDMLRSRLGGGIPNVVFKLPGTLGGLKACQELTSRGIGCTITVDFGMFQHIPFAEAIQAGSAIFACLVEMNGRLAFPARDELLGKLDQLKGLGIDEAAAREAAAWAGVLVAKRLYRYLRDHSIDQSRCKILIASLRIYQGEAYQSLPSAFPDITEITGAALLSVFPNVRYAFDHQADIELEPLRIDCQVPQHVLDTLAYSEIFKQAYYVPGDVSLKPEKVLDLKDEEAVFAWPPVHNTLVEFMNSYNSLVQRLDERKQVVLSKS